MENKRITKQKKYKLVELAATITGIMFFLIWISGNTSMMICGSLGLKCVDIININNDAGAISMIVLGTIFGALPLIKLFFSGK